MIYLWLKLIHIISSTLLFGTGLGSAFYMYRANQTKDLNTMFFAARNVVLVDWVFITPAVIIQPLTGIGLIHVMQLSWSTPWLVASLLLYVFVGVCWIPVVFIQIKMKRMLAQAIKSGAKLPAQYYRYFRTWFILGWPAFFSVIIIFYLMTLKGG